MAIRLVLLLTLAAALCGCNMFPSAMRPANWWKLNGQDPPSNEAMYFSVPDPSSDPFLEPATTASKPTTDEVTFGQLHSTGR